ncbi:MAG: S8 family serine peptidase, partial [Thermoguttaceae bacterium]
MSLWSSFRRFSNFRKNRDVAAGRIGPRTGSSKAPSLKHRELRVEHFEERVLLSITTPDLGGASRSLPALGEIQLVALANSPDDFRPIEPLNADAADTTNTDYLQPGGGLGLDLDGSSYTVGVWDAGAVLSTHQEFGGRVTVVDNVATDDHATHVAGTIGAAGLDPDARGMASGVGIRSYDWNNDFVEMSSPNANDIDISNHSYGPGTGWSRLDDVPLSPTDSIDIWYGDWSVSQREDLAFGSYSANAASLDQVLYTNDDLLSVWAAGNDRVDEYRNLSTLGIYAAYFSINPGGSGWSGPGYYIVNAADFPPPPGDGVVGMGYDSLQATQTAKNALTVGAVNDVTIDPYLARDIQMSNFSGWGPTDDGRVKPDVVGDGIGVYSTVDTSTTAYATKSGTSMAAPNVAGTAVLLKEHFVDKLGYSPSSATLKGLILHTATDAGNVGPDYTYGWGLVDGKAAAEFITTTAAASGAAQITQATYSSTEGEQTYSVNSQGNSSLTATLVWTDPAGTAKSGLNDRTPTLVNDLNIWITDSLGVTYYPWTLSAASPATAAVRTQLNHVDNVEQVRIDLTNAGVYTIHIGAPGTVASQAFSLLVSNENKVVGPELVKIIPNAGGELQAGDTLHVAPRELLLQFNEQQDLDNNTFNAIQITRNGGPITYQLLPGDKVNQVVMRFAESLPDDSYTITIKGTGANPLKNVPKDPKVPPAVFNNGMDQTIDFELDLGAQVVSVVPQPVYRDGFTITATDLASSHDGKTFTVSDGFQSVTFELNLVSDPGGFDPNHVEISFTPGTSADNAAIALRNAIQNEFDDDLLTASLVGAVVTVRGSQASVLAGNAGFAVQSIRTLNQATNKVDVYFSQDDLAPAAATDPTFYRLHRLDAATGAVLETRIPDKVVYGAADDKAQLIFTTPIATGTYHLEIGSTAENNDALAAAVNVGTLWNNTTTASFEGYIGDTGAGTGDVDLYKLVPRADGELTVTQSSMTGGFTPKVRVYTAGQSQMPEFVTGGSSPWAVNAHTTYYVEVASSVGAGSYKLGLGLNQNLDLSNDTNSTYTSATNLGILGAAAQQITGQTIWRGGATILDQPGALDEPGHRHILPEAHFTASPDTTTGVVYYNFADDYGWSTTNQITPEQKQRAREILEIYSYYTGLQFVETASSGIQIVTGDLRAELPTAPANLPGWGDADDEYAMMNGATDWGQSEYGGAWFNTAMQQIGRALRLDATYDIPAVMGPNASLPEDVYPGDNDLIHLDYLWPAVWNDIDLYMFQVQEAGTFSAETYAERNLSNLDTKLVLYREVNVDGVLTREAIAQNDDYYSNDSFIELELELGTYYVGVMSTGISDVDPNLADSGFGGKSTGSYNLKLGFQAEQALSLLDTTDTELDGDADGVPGGTFDFWFQVGSNTIFVDKETGTPAGPVFSEIDEALSFATAGNVVRVVGNGNGTPYLVGYDNVGNELVDGDLVQLPANVTMMIDAGAIFKLQKANVEVGSSSQGITLDGAALQVLGTPFDQVHFRSFRDDSIGGDSDGSSTGRSGGDWGGLVFRADSDHEDQGVFLNWVGWADVQHGGGKVFVGNVEDNYTSVQMLGARPTVAYSTIRYGAGGAISANLASFKETGGRIGPDIHGNTVLNNSVNGLFVWIPTDFGNVVERLDLPARWDDTDIVHVVTENLFIHGTPGGPDQSGVRIDGRLRVDPGVVVKLEGARIHTEIAGQLIAEGLPGYPVIFTALKDDTYGMGGGFDTSNDGSANQPAAGQWGGLIFAPTSKGSLGYVQLSYAGGQTSLDGGFDRFNPIEIHQADVRIANSVIELNASGNAGGSTRGGLGSNTAATIFVRGAQPVIVNNTIIDNQGDAITIDANSMKYDVDADPGRSTGSLDAFGQFDDNRGPLVRLNVLDNTPGGGNQLNSMVVRGSTLTAESIWDDTDIVHVLRNEISLDNLHTYGGLRLQSSQDASLIVKLAGASAGFTANGEPLDIDDRIGGTLQILGTEDYPVVLTSLYDDTAAAGFNLNGDPQGNTFPGATAPAAGDWRSVLIDRYANARNVAIVNEVEPAYTGQAAINDLPMTAQFLGYLAPDLAPGLNVTSGGVTTQGTTDDEKGGDENQRLGFEVQGTISLDAPTDRDVYSFTATAGSEVWLDLDRTSYALDAKVELVLLNGTVIAWSTSNSSFDGSTTVTASNMIQDAYLGDDFYTTNARDAGMHVVLPGTAGMKATYFVRVSSEGGTSSGRYELQVRLRQVDEQPGCTVQYADIRYANNGIEIYGQPAHSILAAEAGERTGDNNARDQAQNLGNLLESDLNAIGVSGNISTGDDVDWYRFEINQEQTLSAIRKTFATVFDIDYADGISRANTVMSIYDANGNLILVSYDSNIEDDQPAAGEGLDRDDLSRGSFDTLDPYIGSVQMPAGSPGATTTYYVAVSSNRQVPTELNQTFQSAATNPNIRLEPVDSLKRVVEEHIGFSGYTCCNSNGSNKINPIESSGILNISNAASLRAQVVPYTLSDVVLF